LKHAPHIQGNEVYIDGGWKISGDRSATDKHFRVYNNKNEIAFTAHDVPTAGAWSFDKQLVRSDDTNFVRKNTNLNLEATNIPGFPNRPIGRYSNGQIHWSTDAVATSFQIKQ
jgi:hypothetical protein